MLSGSSTIDLVGGTSFTLNRPLLRLILLIYLTPKSRPQHLLLRFQHLLSQPRTLQQHNLLFIPNAFDEGFLDRPDQPNKLGACPQPGASYGNLITSYRL
uniref:Uncharacterized protein n=1 Tax=Picea glauca TaxID=3330 RepID=A0A101LYV5_PICGL|nr:hypothetical protein ABT39_MTgene4814 [Picea glauca]QHR88750.1 hypothetical protein Q903MT_gene2764 [Picea sitchensis]